MLCNLEKKSWKLIRSLNFKEFSKLTEISAFFTLTSSFFNILFKLNNNSKDNLIFCRMVVVLYFYELGVVKFENWEVWKFEKIFNRYFFAIFFEIFKFFWLAISKKQPIFVVLQELCRTRMCSCYFKSTTFFKIFHRLRQLIILWPILEVNIFYAGYRVSLLFQNVADAEDVRWEYDVLLPRNSFYPFISNYWLNMNYCHRLNGRLIISNLNLRFRLTIRFII